MSPSRSFVAGPTLAALREATAARHARIDSALPLIREDFTREQYLAYLARLLGWLRPLERCLWQAQWLEDGALRQDKARWAQADLSAGGWTQSRIDALEDGEAFSATDNAERFGLAYVLEGSTLGGQVLHRHLSERLAPQPLRWLQGYGVANGERWKAFVRQLEASLQSPAQREAACRAAERGFDRFSQWMGVTG